MAFGRRSTLNLAILANCENFTGGTFWGWKTGMHVYLKGAIVGNEIILRFVKALLSGFALPS